MILTKSAAIKRLRTETGRSVEWCISAAERLAVVPDGKRMKINSVHLDHEIRVANRPPQIVPPKQLGASHRADWKAP